MTTKGKGYDPYAFGQVKLGAGKASAGGAPEDVLFAEPTAPAAGGADTSWDPPAQFAESTGSEAAAVATTTVPAAPPRARTEKAPSDRAELEAIVAPSPSAEALPTRTGDSAVRKSAAPMVRATPPVGMPEREPAGPAAVAVPFAILVVVESAATWLWLGQQNPVLGGLAAVLGVGLAALGWCALRR